MDTSSFRPGESHVAQQSRRDKLRVQASSASVAHHLDDFSNNLEQLSVHSGLNPDLVQVRNVRNASILYDPTTTVFSSEMLNFATRSTGVLPAQRHAMADQELAAVTHNMSHPVSSNIKANSSDPQACSNWRSSDTQQCYDWMVNYASGSSVGRENNQKPIFVGDVLSNNARVTNISTPTQYVKPIYNGYQSVQSSLAIPSSEIHGQVSQKQHREMQFTSHMHPFYHNTLADVVTSASNAYGNQSTALCFDNANTWMNRPVESCHQWSSEMGLITRKNSQELRTLARDPNTQVLSLSLSSNPPSRGNITQFEEGYESEHMQSKSGELKESNNQDSKILKSSNYSCSMLKPAIINRSTGKSLSDMVGTSNYNVLQNAGPLGPFTGYATILKSSKFLKPAQQLLDEFCRAAGLKPLKTCEGSVRISGDGAETGAKGNNTTFYSSNEVSGDVAVAVASSTCESLRSEYQQKKAKLLYLQEEVCHRYKQYHQQMQMVASSFESVAGLSTATPYLSLALKTVSRNFRCVRHGISDQLKHVAKALGEDLLSPNTGTSSSKGDTSTSRLKYTDQSFQRYSCGGANAGFFESQQHVWRPQRGLPERSVAILRAWLFEHFLHPYPSDTDKHMLATQTGLSRNQVSNWFINARVRVWKPMVEEIHMLETKGLAENQTYANLEGKSAEGTSHPLQEQSSNNIGADSMLNKQLECSGTGSSSGSGEHLDAELWSQEKRSRIEFQAPTSMDGSVMNFLPYQRTRGVDIGGLGAVSLTLGLRHGVENAQQQQQHQQHQQHPQLQQHEDQHRRRFGGQMIHDFVG